MKKIEEFTYFEKGSEKKIKTEVCDSVWKKFSGLMFKKKSLPLLFPFKKNKKIKIHSLFCIPFKAIWIDDKLRVTKKIDIKKIGLNFSGEGKYLLEIPL